MRLVNKTDVGQRRVYDIEVEDVHNFYANGVNVHNCATAGGVSVIKDDGTVVDSSYTGVWGSCSLEQNALVAASQTTGSVYFFGNVGDILADGFSGQIYNRATIPAMSEYFFGGTEGKFAGGALSGATAGITHLYENPTTPASGMVAYTTSTYNTGWMNGDIKGAFLSDTDDTDLVGSGELVTNGTFDTDTDWTKETGWTISGGAATCDDSSNNIYQNAGLVSGKQYAVTFTISAYTSGSVRLNSGSVNGVSRNAVGTYTETITATNSSNVVLDATSFLGSIDNISVKLADADRSVNNNGLIVNGTVTRSPVATGADLVAYSGFSASNYLEQPYNSDLDFGTGDFCVMGWVKTTDTSAGIVERSEVGVTVGRFAVDINGTIRFFTDTGSAAVANSGIAPSGSWQFICGVRNSSGVFVYVDGALKGSSAIIQNVTNTSAVLRLGEKASATFPLSGSLALWRISATAPTAEQIAKIYNDEKVLFQENAQATLYGTSDAVTALAHDDATGILSVGTSAGRSDFQGLRRVNNTTTAVGVAISASNGMIVEE